MTRDLQADMAMLREVLRLAQARDFNAAGAIAQRALAEGFEHPLLLNVAATQLEQEGRFVEAGKLLERAVALAPEDVGVRNALALCLQRLDRPDEALRHVDIVLKQHPELGFAHANKGNAQIALGYLAKAQASHLRALELEPGNVSAMSSLASIASHRGNHEEARSWAQRVLTSIPNFPDAVLSLAAAELAEGQLARAQSLLTGVLADPRVAEIDAARAGGLLGDVFDAGGRYAEALGAYTASNTTLKRLYTQFAGSNLTAYANELTFTVGDTVDEYRVRTPAHSGSDVSEHVFLLGFPRSGTTLLEVVLDGHPQVASLDEHELLIDAVREFMGNPRDLSGLIRASEADLQRLRQAYWERVREGEVDVSGKVFVDKYPMNTLKLPLIARLFPNAKILFVQRDPREVVLACFRRRFRMNPATYDLLTLPGAAALYDITMTCGELMRPVFGDRWRDVRFESLLADFGTQTRDLCEFLGLEWIEGLDDFAKRARERSRSTPSTAQLARGLDRAGANGHWQHYRSALEPVMPTLAKWVERFGYGDAP
jgi:tetratricopeptide (TPR) repeat protein